MTITRPLWRNRDFMLLWSGPVVSTVGMRVSALVDRLDRKRVMIVADAVRAGVLATVVAAVVWGEPALAHLAAAVFLDGACFVFFQLSESAALPHLLHKGQLPSALAQNQAREHGAELAGQPLGGALFALGHAVPFAANAASFVVSLLSLPAVAPRLQEERPPADRGLFGDIGTDIREGLTWLWHQRFLRAIAGLIGATNVVLNALVLVLIVRAQGMGAPPALIGVLLAFAGVAAILGAIAAPRLHERMSARLVVVGSLWVWGAGTAVLVAMPTPLTLGIAYGAMSLIGPLFNVVGDGLPVRAGPRPAAGPHAERGAADRLGREPARATARRHPADDGRLDRRPAGAGRDHGRVALTASLLRLTWPG